MEGTETPNSCEACEKNFRTEGELKAHRAKIHQEEVLVRSCAGTEVKLTRNEASKRFLCPGECGYSNEVPRNIQRHTRFCRTFADQMQKDVVEGIPVEEGGAQTLIEIAPGPKDSTRSSLISSPPLESFRIKVSAFLGRPICGSCGIALEVGSCNTHLRVVHAWTSLSVNVDDEVSNLLKSRGIEVKADDMITQNFQQREAFEGLRLYRDAWKCLHCENRGAGYFVPQQMSMTRHLRREHATSSTLGGREQSMERCEAVQTIFGGSRRKFFPVFAPRSTKLDKDKEAIKKIVAEMKLSNSQLSPARSHREFEIAQVHEGIEGGRSSFDEDESENLIDAILAETRWHEIVLSYPIQKIKLYAARAGRTNVLEQRICELVHTYLKLGTHRLQYNTSLHLRRKLMGEKGTSFRYFSGLQTSKALQQYADSICRLVLMCIRRSANADTREQSERFEEFPEIPDELKKHASRLWKKVGESFNRTKERCPTSASQQVDIICRTFFETTDEALNQDLFLLHQMALSLFCVKFPISEKRERMVIHQYLAFVSKLDDERFLRVDEIPPIVSRLQYICRVTVMFQIAIEEAKGSETDKALAWLEYIGSEGSTPFVELSEVFGLATSISNSSGSLPEIIWDTSCPNGTKLFIQGISVSVQSLSQFLQDIVKQAEKMLYEDILLTGSLCKKPIDKEIENLEHSLLTGDIQDDLRNEAQGYYFGDDIRNRELLSEMSESFLRRVLLDPSRRHEFFKMKSEKEWECISWCTQRMMLFLNLCENFIEVLIPLLQIMSGQPARCTELATTQIRNSNTARRSLMLVNKRLVNILSYSKTRSMTGRPRLVPRFLDKRISSLLAIYLIVVRPIEVFFMRRLVGDERANDHATYLFSKIEGRMGGKEVARTFEKVLRRSWIPLTSRMYRHVCTAFTRELLRGKSSRTQVWLPYDEQAAHSAETAESRYGRSISDHRNITSHEFVAYYAASVSWQKLLGFSQDERLGISEEGSRLNSALVNNAQSIISLPEGSAVNLAAIEGSLRRIDEGFTSLKNDVQLLKERKITFPSPHLQGAQQEQMADPAFTKDLEIYTTHTNSPKNGVDYRKQGDIASGKAEPGLLATLACSSRLPSLEKTLVYRNCLQKLLNDAKAEFKSPEQLLAIHEVCSRDRDVLAILPTGAGKSMLFLVPCILEIDLVTVIICPLVALNHDMKGRFFKAGLKIATWSERFEKDFRAVIVSIETAASAGFLQFLEQLCLQKKLARVVIDEAHIVLTSADYRPKLKELFAQRPSRPVPLLLLTASLPPCMTKELCRALGCPRPLMIRSPSTARPNIRYSLRQGSRIGTQARLKTIVAILKHHTAQFDEKDRAIIYCLRKSTTEMLARRLSGEEENLKAISYHSESCQKKLLGDTWRLGLAPIMVATGAFGAGIDYPHVRLVIHDGEPRTLLDFAQESGRAGRDGRKAESILLLQPPIMRAPGASKRSIEEMYQREDSEVRGWIAACSRGSCIRQTLHSYLDGVAVPCVGSLQSQMQPCGVCEKTIKKGIKHFEESFSEEHLNVKTKKMSISSSLSIECRRADAERKDIKSALAKFNDLCNLLKLRECPHCMGAKGKRSNTPSPAHSPGRCPYMQKRCLRCYSTAHNSYSQCPSPPFSFPEREGKCYQCGFRNEYLGEIMHEKGSFGRQCTSNAKFAREVILSTWAYQKDLLSKEVSDFESLRCDVMKFQEWLYDVRSKLPNIVTLFNKIYASEEAPGRRKLSTTLLALPELSLHPGKRKSSQCCD